MEDPHIPVILFASDYFDRYAPASVFEREYELAQEDPRVEALLCNIDEFFEGKPLALDVRLDAHLDAPRCGIWRGWMMLPEQYRGFFNQCHALGLDLLTTPEQYELMHCFPHAYRLIPPGSTPHVEVFERTIDAATVNSAFDAFMVKDYVKSLKQTEFPAKVETPITQERADELSRMFIEQRGAVFTGGLVCKQFAQLKYYGRRTNEWRAFYFGGRLLDLSGNSLQYEFCPAPPADLIESARRFPSPFYTVDFAELEDDTWTILETGDGQVSGLATEAFAEEFMPKLFDALCAEGR